MTWTDSGHPQAALVCALVSGLLGLLVPTLIGRVPEPAPTPESGPGPDAPDEPSPPAETSAKRLELDPPPPKEPYADIAVLPRLALWTAVSAAVVGGVLGASVGWSGALVYLSFLTPIGIALALVDWRTTLLPTRIIAPSYAVLVGLILLAALVDSDRDALLHAVYGWLVIGGFFLVLWLILPRGIGYGDVRLSGLLGLALGYLGWPGIVVGLYAVVFVGGVGQGLALLLGLVPRRRAPFGPFMLLGAVVAVVFGPAVFTGLGY